jgi:hypothetical protein
MRATTIPVPMVEREPMDEFASLYYYYRIEKEAEVISFVRKYPFLLSILEEAPKQIYRIFGRDVTVCLELHHDPEEGWDELFIVIKSAYSAEEAIRLENRLFQEWFLDKIKETKGKLNIIEESLRVLTGKILYISPKNS